MEIMALLMIGTWILWVVAIACVVYAIIRFAVVHALRQARHEARIEQGVPNAATWLKGDERRLLEISNSSRRER
ncbi:hypothetical protein [Microbacterium sp. USHLN186]|uniref:hypothetical protein n=1 Tax=Microbacterium sp. USHLN186 TaxID=3081286 RepID=UPI0030160A85